MMAVEGSCCVVLAQLLAELPGVPLQAELPPSCCHLLCCCSGLRVPVTQLGEAPEPTRCAVVQSTVGLLQEAGPSVLGRWLCVHPAPLHPPKLYAGEAVAGPVGRGAVTWARGNGV